MNNCDTCDFENDFTGTKCSCNYKPKEKEMEKQKFQFESEEQAREIIELLVCRRTGCEKEDDECTQCDIDKLKRNGYIRKSELQTLVDEAEEMYMDYLMRGLMPPLRSDTTKLLNKMYKAIQELKAENERLKK